MKKTDVMKWKRYCCMFLLLSIGVSCTVRDDFPKFDDVPDEQVDEDLIPPSNAPAVVTSKMQAGSTFFKTFLHDSTRTLSPGITYTHIRFLNDLDQRMSVHVLEIDREGANVGMQALSPFGDYLYATAQSLPEMMGMNAGRGSGHRLVAAVSGGGVVSGQPVGIHVQNGRVVKATSSVTVPLFAVRKDNGDFEVLNSPSALTFPVNPVIPAQYSQVVGGAEWLLYRGVEVSTSLATVLARTGVGFSEDMKRVYCISVDGADAFSAGITLNNLRTLFKSLDCYTAFNLNAGAQSVMGVHEDAISRMSFVQKSLLPDIRQAAAYYAIGFVVNP